MEKGKLSCHICLPSRLLLNVRFLLCALWWRTSGGRRELAPDGRPSRVSSGAELLLLLAAASTTAALLLLPAVTLHRPAPRRDQARRRPATRPPAPLRVQVQHAHPPPVAPAEPLGLKAPTAASRSPMHAALARSPEPAPAGGRARCWPDHQLRANFPGARAAPTCTPQAQLHSGWRVSLAVC